MQEHNTVADLIQPSKEVSYTSPSLEEDRIPKALSSKE
jgi:hypothetical protein